MSEIKPIPGELEIQLMEWAEEYAQNPTNKLQGLAYDPSTYPGQEGHAITDGGHGKHTAHVIAREAFKPHSFDQVLEQLSSPQHEERLIAGGELLAGGNNVVLGTNHGDLIDIAIAHAAVYERMHQLGYESRNAMVISKMVAFLAYEFYGDAVPCAEVLQNLEDDIYLSYPRTASADKHGLARFLPNEVERHNKHMRADIVKSLGKGGLLLAVAMSGTTDKPLDINTPDKISMAPITEGTSRMLTQDRTYILPASLYYKTGVPHAAITDTPRFISNSNVLHAAMGTIAANLTESIPNIEYIYNTPS